MLFNAEQEEKGFAPICVTESGMVIEVREVQELRQSRTKKEQQKG